MDKGGCGVEFGGLERGKKKLTHPDFSENRDGWGNKKATASTGACRG